MEGKLFDDMPSAPKAPRLSKDFDLHGDNDGENATGFYPMDYVQDPKMAIPILMSLIGLILIVVATQVFNLEVSDMQSFIGDSSTTMASIWTSTTEFIANLAGDLLNKIF